MPSTRRFKRRRNRKRSRNKGPQLTREFGYVLDTQGRSWTSEGVWCSLPPYSRMEDETGVSAWHPVSHFRARNLATPGNVACPSTDNQSKWLPSVVAQEEQASWAMELAHTAANDWLQTAAQSFSVQFKESASLGVFLGEMRGGIKEVLPTLQDLRENAAGNFLKIKFGIEPFIKDLTKMVGVWGRYRKRFVHLREHMGQTYVEHAKTTVSPSVPDYTKSFLLSVGRWQLPPPGQSQPLFMPHPFSNTYKVTEHETKFIVAGLITNEICDMDNVISQADAFGRVVGLGNSPRIVWNLLPWMWLVDWFAETDKLMDQFELQSSGPFDGQLILRDLFLSVRTRIWGDCNVQCDEMAEPTSKGPYMSSFYVRYPAGSSMGAPSSFIQPSLDGGQAAILASLLLSRSRVLPAWSWAWNRLQKYPKWELRRLDKMSW